VAVGGVRPARRWVAAVNLIVAGPIVIAALFSVSGPVLQTPLFLWVAMGWAAGLLGVHLLPVRPSLRVVTAIIYTPIAGYLMVVTVLTMSCLQGACI